MKTELTLAIDHLYDVFSSYTANPTDLRACSCDCCVDDDEIREVTIKSLKELTEEALGHIARSAISTFGNVNHYKHFLPRIFDVMSKPNSDILGDFTCFEKLNYGEWETWPDIEQRAIEHYFDILWKTTIQDTNTNTYQIQCVFEVVLLYQNKEMIFNAWEHSNSLSSTMFIVDSILNGWQCINIKRHKELITKWLYSKAVLQKLECAFFKITDPEIVSKISITYTILEKKYPIYFN
jgi:hypothetical protein